jgi:hypothetical protein
MDSSTTTLGASKQGLEHMYVVCKRKGWTKTSTSAWWLAAHTSRATLRRFWQGAKIQRGAFISICEVVGEDWRQIAETEDIEAESAQRPQSNLADAPQPFHFQGRTKDLHELQQSTLNRSIRLVILRGAVGIGKTYLAAQFTLEAQEKFDCVVWQTLQSTATLTDIVTYLGLALGCSASPEQSIAIEQIFKVLRQNRCFVVLDQVNTVLEGEGDNWLVQFLNQVASLHHQSCFLVTTCEPLPAALEQHPAVAVRYVSGLDRAEARSLLRSNGLSGEAGWDQLIHLYGGYPCAMVMLSSLIKELYHGNVITFLRNSTMYIPDRVQGPLEQQLGRLPVAEKQVLCLLAQSEEGLPQADIESQVSVARHEVLKVLMALKQRALIEAIGNDVSHEAWFSMPLLVRKQVLRMGLCDSAKYSGE